VACNTSLQNLDARMQEPSGTDPPQSYLMAEDSEVIIVGIDLGLTYTGM